MTYRHPPLWERFVQFMTGILGGLLLVALLTTALISLMLFVQNMERIL